PRKAFFGIASVAPLVENRHFVGEAWQGTRVAKIRSCPDRSLPRRLSRMDPIMNRPGRSPQPQGSRRRPAWPQPLNEAHRFLSKTEAQEMLDWHEAHGAQNLQDG